MSSSIALLVLLVCMQMQAMILCEFIFNLVIREHSRTLCVLYVQEEEVMLLKILWVVSRLLLLTLTGDLNHAR